MSREHDYCVYILTNHTGPVLYIGITSDLEGRLWEHAHGESGSKFTRKYHVNTLLLYYEAFGGSNDAIAREKQLKGWTRVKKEALVRTANPTFADLGALLKFRGVCRQPEGLASPVSQTRLSTALHSAQDDRSFESSVERNGSVEDPPAAFHSAKDDRKLISTVATPMENPITQPPSKFFLGLRTVIYHAPDLAKAKTWYSEALGTDPYFDEPFYVGFNVGGYELGLDPDPASGPAGNGGSVAYWGVADAGTAYARLLSLGATEHGAVREVGGGIKVGTVLDPFGNVFGIIENPHFSLPEPS